MPRLWPSPAPWCPAARPQSLWRKVRFAVRGLPSPWDGLGAGHRKVLGEAQPSRWGHSWVPCKPSLLSLSLGVPSGCRGHHPSLCSQPLGGPFQPRTLGLIPTHTHTPAPLLLPSPTLLPPGPKTTSEAAWGYRPDPAPTSPGPRAVCVCVCVYPPWLPARARCPGEPCQAVSAAPAFSLCTSRPFSRRDPGRSWSALEVSGPDGTGATWAPGGQYVSSSGPHLGPGQLWAHPGKSPGPIQKPELPKPLWCHALPFPGPER